MLRIAITNPEPPNDEAEMIRLVLDAGWDFVHLRHPNSTTQEVKRIISNISPEYHKKIRLHGHFNLINEFNIGGLHLNRRCSIVPDNYSGMVSKSCHSVDEVFESSQCDYVFLSPIYPSVSKPGYENTKLNDLELQRLNQISEPDVIALGGITPEHICKLNKEIFGGFAVLGSLLGGCSDISEVKNRLDKFEKFLK